MAVRLEHVTESAGGHEAKGVLAPLMRGLSERVDHVRDQPLFQRDPEFLRRQLPAVTRYVNYFSPEVRGQVNLPASGPALVVGNHSGLFYMPDAWVVGLEIVRRRGLDQPAYAMGYDLLFGIPGVGPFLRRIGAIPAGGQAAEQGLARAQVKLAELYAGQPDMPDGSVKACEWYLLATRGLRGGHLQKTQSAYQRVAKYLTPVQNAEVSRFVQSWKPKAPPPLLDWPEITDRALT